MTYEDLFFHGQREENEKVHDEYRPEDRDVECFKASANHRHQNSTKGTVPTQQKTPVRFTKAREKEEKQKEERRRRRKRKNSQKKDRVRCERVKETRKTGVGGR